MKKWEYLTLRHVTPSEMDKWGKKGWELVCCERSYMYFKREIQGE